jgi:hypothetical protein
VDVLDPSTISVVASLEVPGYPGGGAASGPAIWMPVTTPAFSSAVWGYDGASLAWIRDAGDPLLPSLDFYGNLRATADGRLAVPDFSADLLLLEDPTDPGVPAAWLVGDGPIDVGLAEHEGPVSLALSGLSASDVEDGVRLAWRATPEAGVASFDVQRRLAGDVAVRVASSLPAARDAEWIDRRVPPDVTATWTVRALDARGRALGAESTTWVRRSPGTGRLAIRRIAPNPFRGSATVEWHSPRGGAARVEILDVAGRRVLARDLGAAPPGAGSWRFDGTAGDGGPIAPGAYYVRLVVGGETACERGLRLR